MFKKFIVILTLVFFLCACDDNKVYYSSILEKNRTVIYQFEEENSYLSMYPNTYVFHRLDEIKCDNFTVVIIDESLGEISLKIYEQTLNFMLSENKIILIYYNSDKIKYLEPKVRINFNSITGEIGKELTSYEIHVNEYKDSKQLYIAQYCFRIIEGGIVEYMKFQ